MASSFNHKNVKVIPGPNRTDPPRFSDMDSRQFEEMTCALLEKEPGISTADLYRKEYESQYGIDVIARTSSARSVEVASCKCYTKVAKGKIPEWSNDFLNHWNSHWKDKGVIRFILAVACDVHAKGRDEEIAVEREKFKSYGIEYEVWSRRTLQEKLRPHRGVVSQFLGEYWENVLCGSSSPPAIPVAQTDATLVTNALLQQVALLQTGLSDEVKQRIDHMRDDLRKGDYSKVTDAILSLRSGSTWIDLSATLRAQVICLQASLRLHADDHLGAEVLVKEAEAISANEATLARSLVIYERDGAREALKVLGNPTALGELHLKVGLLLELKDFPQAEELLSTKQAFQEKNAETIRLRAYTALLQGRKLEAFKEIESAEQIAPEWLSIQRAGAIIRYSLALSPHVGPDMYMYPYPVPSELVLETDVATKHLQKALDGFASIAKITISEKQNRQNLIWKIACLCNLKNLKDATIEINNYLEKDSADPDVIGWALARGIGFNRERSLNDLQKMLDSGAGSAAQALAYAWIVASEQRYEAGSNALRKYVERFKTPEEREAYRLNIEKLSASEDHISTDFDSKIPSTPEGDSPSSAISYEHKNLNEVEAQYLEEIQRQPIPVSALLLAQMLARGHRWKPIYENCASLISFETPTAIEIAAIAAFNIGRPEKTLEILDASRHQFPGGTLPHNLRAVEAEALINTGKSAEALALVSVLASESLSASNMLHAANLHIRAGHIAGAIPAVREANQRQSLSAEDALRFSRIFSTEDPEFAAALLKQAINAGIPDSLAASAYFHAHRLGREAVANALFPRLADAANHEGSGIRILDLASIAEMQKQQYEQGQLLQHQYLIGAAPIHALWPGQPDNLARMYRLSKPSLGRQRDRSIFLIRNGARPVDLDVGMPLREWKLHIDITSLLLAMQLNLLPKIEHLYSAIFIPSALPASLMRMELSLAPDQPKHLEAQRSVLLAFKTGHCTSIDLSTRDGAEMSYAQAALDWAAEANGLIVDFKAPEEISEGDVASYTAIVSIVDALRKCGQIDSSQYDEKIKALGTLSSSSFGAVPSRGRPILFAKNTLSVIADAGLLSEVLDTFEVCVDKWLIDEIGRRLEQADDTAEMEAQIKSLRRRVAEGIKSGKYVTTSTTWALNGQGSDDKENNLSETVIEAGIVDLLRSNLPRNSVVWIDDRYLTAYPSMGVAPIVGVFEILGELRKENALETVEYFASLIRLRASYALFLPVTAEEVAYHLESAEIVDDKLVETPALATLRRYIAKIALCEEYLNIGERREELRGRPDEVLTLLGARNAASTALVLVWNSNLEKAESLWPKSDWIMSSLALERFAGEHLPQEAREIRKRFPAMELASLMLAGFNFRSSHSSRVGDSNIAAYFDWLKKRILTPRFTMDPELERETADAVIEVLGSMIEPDAREGRDSRAYEGIKRAYTRKIVEYFPESIKLHIAKSDRLGTALGILPVTHVKAGIYEFEQKVFWKALQKALKYGQSSLRDIRTNERVAVRRGKNKFEVCVSGKKSAVLRDPTFCVLTCSDVEAKKTLLGEPILFDTFPDDREKLVENIFNASSTDERMRRLEDSKDESAAYRYQSLQNTMKPGSSFSFQLFYPPSAHALLSHLRIRSNSSLTFGSQLEHAAEQLTKEHGQFEAISRLMSLPCPLPQYLVNSFNALDASNRIALLEKLRSYSATPLRIFHVLRLQLLLPKEQDQESCKNFFEFGLKAVKNLTPVFIALLKWVGSVFTSDSAWEEVGLTGQLALPWIHADKLLAVVVSNSIDPEFISEQFSLGAPKGIVDLLLMRHQTADDVVYHTSISPEVLLYYGMGYVLDGKIANEVLSPLQLEAIRTALIQPSMVADEELIPAALKTNRYMMPNRINSFFSSRPVGIFSSEEAVSDSVIKNMEASLISEVELDPYSHARWYSLLLLSSPVPPEEHIARIAAVIEKFDPILLGDKGDDPVTIAQAIAHLVSKLGMHEAKGKVLEIIMYVARQNSIRFARHKQPFTIRDDTDPGMTLSVLVDTCGQVSKSTDLQEGFRNFADAITMLGLAWPSADHAIMDFLETFYRITQRKNNDSIWKAWLRFRELS